MIRIGIMGAGSIAHKMADTIMKMDKSRVEVYAIAAREQERAEAFAKQHQIKKAYGSYEQMLKDEEVDLVYIAIPHSLHYKGAKMCIEAGKHVLCEKPFTVTEEQGRKLCFLASQKNVFLAEAMWTRYMPSRKIIDEIIQSGVIGEVTSLTANLGYDLRDIPRLWDPTLAGGALLDVGIYLIHFARMVFGTNLQKVISHAEFSKEGVDYSDSIVMTFEGGKEAVTHCNVASILNRSGAIFGTKGYIEIVNINNPERIQVFDKNYNLVKEYSIPEQISGYEYEVKAAVLAIENGKKECKELPQEETLEVLKIMDSIRNEWGYVIPEG